MGTKIQAGSGAVSAALVSCRQFAMFSWVRNAIMARMSARRRWWGNIRLGGNARWDDKHGQPLEDEAT